MDSSFIFYGNDFFKNMVYSDNLLKSHQSKRCPQCGITYDEFNRVSKFGCDRCYETFASEIKPLLQRLQGSSEYEGTVPSHGHNVFKAKYELKSLRHQLDSAIQAENFEDAAILRDKIKELEAIIGGNKRIGGSYYVRYYIRLSFKFMATTRYGRNGSYCDF